MSLNVLLNLGRSLFFNGRVRQIKADFFNNACIYLRFYSWRIFLRTTHKIHQITIINATILETGPRYSSTSS